MNVFVKNLGIIIMILALGVLVYKQIAQIESNTLLVIGGAGVLIGLVVYILINRFSESV